MKLSQKPLYCKVYYSLLAICYLEVVLWSSCWLLTTFSSVPGEVADTHNYLLRETVNLKNVQAHKQSGESAIKDKCPEVERHKELLVFWVYWLKQQVLQTLRSPIVQQTFVGINNLPVQKGPPAPFTGIEAFT